MRNVFRLSLLCLALSILSVNCATKAPPAVTGAPRHPDFVFPAVPAGAADAQASRIDRGWQYLQLDDFRNAEREFAAALRQDESFHPAETAMAYVALARGNEKDAVTRFDRALQAEAAYVPALVGRGHALLELDRQGEALASFEAALSRDPSLTQLRTRVEVLRVRAAQEMLARAKSATDARRWDEARAAYEQAIAASPDSAFLYRELAAVEQQSGRAAEALERYRRAAQLDPSDAKSLAAIGGILEGQGDDIGALSAYERARAIDPPEVPDSVLARVRDRVRAAKLPEEYRAIPGEESLTRAQLAALIAVRLESLIARTRPRQAIITDVRDNWAQQWITPVVRSGIMETLPNYEFEPSRRLRRGELATVVSRVLGLIGTMKPDLAKKWQSARVTIADVPPTHLSYPAVSMAVAAGVLPLSGGTFDLLRPVSGAEAMEVVGQLDALAR